MSQIVEAVKNNVKFLCWAAFVEPHPPFFPPKEIYESFDQSMIELPEQAPPDAALPHEYILNKRKEWAHLTDVEIRQIIAGYYGMIQLVDGYCGMVLDTLERLGIRDETIVMWTVDHGDQMWEHEMFLKFCMYEASVHIPLLINVPGMVPAVRGEFVEHIDLFPTLCDLVGAEIPNTVQGTSLVPLLSSEPTPDDWRDAVFSQIGIVEMIRTKEWKLITYKGKPGELYDMKNDPDEFYNLIGQPEHADTIKALFERLTEWKKEHSNE